MQSFFILCVFLHGDPPKSFWENVGLKNKPKNVFQLFYRMFYSFLKKKKKRKLVFFSAITICMDNFLVASVWAEPHSRSGSKTPKERTGRLAGSPQLHRGWKQVARRWSHVTQQAAGPQPGSAASPTQVPRGDVRGPDDGHA